MDSFALQSTQFNSTDSIIYSWAINQAKSSELDGDSRKKKGSQVSVYAHVWTDAYIICGEDNKIINKKVVSIYFFYYFIWIPELCKNLQKKLLKAKWTFVPNEFVRSQWPWTLDGQTTSTHNASGDVCCQRDHKNDTRGTQPHYV